MNLNPKTITVFLDDSPAGKKRAVHAASLAQRWGAHLVGVNVAFTEVELPASMSYARGNQALRQVIAHKRQLESAAEAAMLRVNEEFLAVCAEVQVSGEARPIDRENHAEHVIRTAFHSDLVVVGHPEPHGLPHGLSVEKLASASGVPTLIVPNAWEGRSIGNNVLIGWKETQAARRAVASAMAFLVAAQSVTVLVIEAEKECRSAEGRGSNVTTWLHRHGAHVTLVTLASRGFSIPAVLLGYAEQSGSDLLVVGAYSQARFKERVLGGTTRTLLAHTSTPTFISK